MPAAGFAGGGRDHEPRDVGAWYKLEKVQNPILPWTSEQMQPCNAFMPARPVSSSSLHAFPPAYSRFLPSWPLVPPLPTPDSHLQELPVTDPPNKVHVERCWSHQLSLRFATFFLN